MVDTIQPRSLSCFRIRKRRHDHRMNLQRTKIPRASQHEMGWKAPRTFPLLPVAGELFLLTFPFIERACLDWSVQLPGGRLRESCHQFLFVWVSELSRPDHALWDKISTEMLE